MVGGSLAASCRPLRTMVIVVPTATVNRTSTLQISHCAAGISRIPGTGRGRRVYTPFIAILKLPFKFARHDLPNNKPANGVGEARR
jgi:hypothetical protein